MNAPSLAMWPIGRPSAPRRALTLAACVCALAVAFAAPVDATPIPTGAGSTDDLLLNFDTSGLAVPSQGMFTIFLATSGLEAGDTIVADLFASADGQGRLGMAYSGPFVWLSINCRIRDALCTSLLDGDFSVGLRMASGGVDMEAAFAYTIDQNQQPSSPIFATPGSLHAPLSNDVREPQTGELLAVGMLALIAATRHGSSGMTGAR